jgi:hypothetical protein
MTGFQRFPKFPSQTIQAVSKTSKGKNLVTQNQ